MNKKNDYPPIYLEIEDMRGDEVQDKDTHTWVVYDIDDKIETLILISEEKDLKNTKMKIVDVDDFIHNFYKYRGAVLKKIVDMYS